MGGEGDAGTELGGGSTERGPLRGGPRVAAWGEAGRPGVHPQLPTYHWRKVPRASAVALPGCRGGSWVSAAGAWGRREGCAQVPGEHSPGRRSRCCVSGGVEGGSSGSCCPGGSNSRARVSVKNFIWCLRSVSHWPNVCPMTVPEPVAEQWTWSVASPWGAWSCRLSSSSGTGMVPARDAERMTP